MKNRLDGPNGDFGFHHEGGMLLIIRQPDLNVPFIEKDPLKRHDDQDAQGRHRSPGTFDRLKFFDSGFHLILLFVMEDVDEV